MKSVCGLLLGSNIPLITPDDDIIPLWYTNTVVWSHCSLQYVVSVALAESLVKPVTLTFVLELSTSVTAIPNYE